MKRFIAILMCGMVAWCTLSCGGPKGGDPNLTPQRQESVQDKAKKKTEVAVTPQKSQPAEGTSFAILVLFIVTIAEGVCIVWLILTVINHERTRKNTDLYICRLKGDKKTIEQEINKLKGDKKTMEQDIQKLKDELQRMVNEVSGRVREGEKPSSPTVEKSGGSPGHTPPKQAPQQAAEEYVAHFKDGILRVVGSKENTQYKVIFPIGASDGKFEFAGDPVRAIKNKNSILDNVCQVINDSPNAKQIRTISQGTCKRQADNSWKVITEAKISLI